MYTDFFGLTEIPFSIAPDPAYLFLSERHREALAHLTFGLTETGGFVLLTGEVGTGKTTVSRCLLEQLPEGTQTAFILNPALNAKELLASVCDELQIPYSATTASLKTLFDGIRDHLLSRQQEQQATVLLIDEAQHLQPEVLEQLRLLTNLETNKRKLLKVILIGQPELQELLRQQQLRQLAQRITARYHLLPLNADEVVQYVQHRLKVANCQRPIFTRKALNQLHRLSGGVPRLINLLCDRALLAAYSQQRWQVDHKLLQSAAKEVQGLVEGHAAGINRLWRVMSAACILATLSLGVGAWLAGQYQPTTALQEAADSADNSQTEQHWSGLLAESRELSQGFRELAAVWGADTLSNCGDAEREYGLACVWEKTDLARVVQIAQPVLLTLQDSDGRRFYATLQAVTDQEAILHLAGERVAVSRRWLMQHWQGNLLRLWQPPTGFKRAIGPDASGPVVQWLEIQLAFLQGEQPRSIQRYDMRLAERLRWYQMSRELQPDGIAGAKTLIRLTQELNPDLPRLEG